MIEKYVFLKNFGAWEKGFVIELKEDKHTERLIEKGVLKKNE